MKSSIIQTKKGNFFIKYSKGGVSRTFDTRQEAFAYATKLGCKITKTYDIQLHTDDNSESKGFKVSLEEAKRLAKTIDVSAYKGGVLQIVCNETNEVKSEFQLKTKGGKNG